MTERFPAFFQDIFVTIVKIAFHLSKVTIWGKQTRKKNLWFFVFNFGQWAEKNWPVVKHFEQGQSKQQSTRPRVRNVFLGKKNLNSSRTFSQNLSAIYPKVCGEVAKTEISISRGSCQGKTYCSQEVTHFCIKLLLWVKSFHPSCKALLSDLSKDCILIDQKINLQSNYSEKMTF